MTASITVIPANPRAPEAQRLLQASHRMMHSLFSPEDNYALDIEALLAPNIRFFIASDGTHTLGTGALALRDGYGEVKAMFTAPAARGRGVAAGILRRLEEEARDLDLPCLRLETADVLDGAVRLYARHGFRRCGRFGDYTPNETSIYMEKSLV